MSKLDEILDIPFIKELGKGLNPTLQKKQQIKDLMFELIGKDEPITSELKPDIVNQRLTRNQVKDYQRRKVELL